MKTTGTFRLHFSRHGAAPLVWCVSTDEWELAVKHFVVDGPKLRSVYQPKATADDDDGKPSAWLEVTGELEVCGSVARITSA